MVNVSLIIKAYNEEKHIAKCITSAVNALKGLKGEIILVDSLSEDETVDIANKYPIKIIQLKKDWFKSPAAALQTGYTHSTGDYILVLDGDMSLDKNFIKKALHYFSDKKVGAVSGELELTSNTADIFKKEINLNKGNKLTTVDTLVGCMLIRREAVNKLDFFVNPFLFADEEAEFCYRLKEKGFNLIKVPIRAVQHFGWNQNALGIYMNKFKTKYLYGPGQVIRYSLETKLFWKHLKRHRRKIYIIIWWIFCLVSLTSLFFTKLGVYLFFIISFLFLVKILFNEKSIKNSFISFISWNLKAVGLILGFIQTTKDPKSYPTNAKIIKG